ncbi:MULTISPECIES: EamA family transporter [unclassified Coleofasciculus]|uniref:EamA family transporter n=1 Tax=unclassified Coleofasciculus TaxID=2692782 RepID=UPI00187E203D|nr:MULTISPECIES: EamA family transporter [unclassified Coleofasciculus]MBE9127173.1 EamA family transporter [Coleofasciculus sp. LEGE 07081]MBE9150494.1 EamA family transporter [Coleofasciculus sp. LEGE 07092]
MVWFILAALTAVFESLKDVTSKHGLKKIDDYIVSWSLMIFSLPLLLPLLFFIEIPSINESFWLALMIGGSLNVISMILYIKALKLSDLSITVPLITFTPLFLLITSPIIVGEYPTLSDAMGMILIVAGSYLLNIKEKNKGYLAPFKAILEARGAQLMLLVAFIWSITSNFDKIGVQNSSPTFWAIANYSFIAAGILPIMLYKSHRHLNQIPANLISLVPIGLFQGAAVLFQMQAIDRTLVAHVISVKRMSALISVWLAYLIFKERGIKERAAGAATMIIGVLLITLL